jgi:hypothetical protein
MSYDNFGWVILSHRILSHLKGILLGQEEGNIGSWHCRLTIKQYELTGMLCKMCKCLHIKFKCNTL